MLRRRRDMRAQRATNDLARTINVFLLRSQTHEAVRGGGGGLASESGETGTDLTNMGQKLAYAKAA